MEKRLKGKNPLSESPVTRAIRRPRSARKETSFGVDGTKDRASDLIIILNSSSSMFQMRTRSN